MVNSVLLKAAVGVPLIVPVRVSKLKPSGKLGVIWKELTLSACVGANRFETPTVRLNSAEGYMTDMTVGFEELLARLKNRDKASSKELSFFKPKSQDKIKNQLNEKIEVPIIYYTKVKDGISVDLEELNNRIANG